MAFYAVFMPQHSDIPVDEALTGGKARFSFAGLGSKFWVFIVCMALGIAAAAAFMNNISMIVVVTGIDTTGAAVGIIMTGFGAGLMVGGAIYPIAYRLLKRAAMPVFLLIDAVCFLAIMANTYYMTLIVCATIIGVVFGFLNAAWGDMANKKVADYPAASSSGASVFIAASGLAQFLSPLFPVGLCLCCGTDGSQSVLSVLLGDPYHRYRRYRIAHHGHRQEEQD